MAVSCKRQIQALWCNEEESNAWVWLSGAGWRKLDDRNRDACTDLLEIASLAKNRNAEVMVREEMRGDTWFITEIYDFSLGGKFAVQVGSVSGSERTAQREIVEF